MFGLGNGIDESGQASIEWVGLLLLIGSLFTVGYNVLDGDWLADKIKCAIVGCGDHVVHESKKKSRLTRSDTAARKVSAIVQDDFGTARTASYPGQGSANDMEAEWCVEHIWRMNRCFEARDLANEALGRARQVFPVSSLHNGSGDAFRHCLWSGWMTLNWGKDAAKGFGDRHEYGDRRNKTNPKELSMDRRNNYWGRRYASRDGADRKSLDRSCANAAKRGVLVTLTK